MKKYGQTMPGKITSAGRRRIKNTKADQPAHPGYRAERLYAGDRENRPRSGDLQGEYSRRISEKDRLVYHMENGRLYIAHCRGHYGDK